MRLAHKVALVTAEKRRPRAGDCSEIRTGRRPRLHHGSATLESAKSSIEGHVTAADVTVPGDLDSFVDTIGRESGHLAVISRGSCNPAGYPGFFTHMRNRARVTLGMVAWVYANRPAKARNGRSALVSSPGGAATTDLMALSAGRPVTVIPIEAKLAGSDRSTPGLGKIMCLL